MEAKNLHKLNERLYQDGYQIGMVHPFYIAENTSEVDTEGYDIQWYRGKEIDQFRGDSRFCEAYTFCKTAPDMVGVAALKDGEILGMAGASMDSPVMWQIGINVEPEGRGKGIATMLVSLLKNEILSKGRLPYYGTSMGHIASQKVALGAGFVPAVLNTGVYDAVLPVSNEDAFATAKLLAKKEGISVGISSGAALHAAITLASREENKGKTIVALLPDSGDRYYSTPLFTEA